ncbi:YitT family protein [Allobacillus halotolerans]|uniref:YitT family protein n=2 Tax=Allobacillus halotolerans TaxID=570278 RepID=A0ABS6GQ38_9BACI|nr:YitT family protein [Allobacillus halotolerans]
MFVTRWLFYFIGLLTFSYGITIALSMQHLGIHPWDVLAVALFEKLGLSIGTWAIIISLILIIVSWFLDKSYIKLGTFLNGVLVGAFVDLFLWIDFLPNASLTWTDSLIMIGGMVVMGIGGGLYNSAQVGSGPRDGFMLSIADKTNAPIGRVRIIVESFILLLGLILGGPVFWFTLIFTFVQSPVFAYSFTRFKTVLSFIERRHHTTKNKSEAV